MAQDRDRGCEFGCEGGRKREMGKQREFWSSEFLRWTSFFG